MRQKIVIGILLLIVIAYHSTNNIVDDAFITYRYTANLVLGNGLVYNTGELVLGTTTVGYTLWLAPLAWLFGWQAIPTISLMLNTLSLAIALLFYIQIGRSIFNNNLAGVMAGFALILSNRTLLASAGGMETALFHLLVTSSIYCLIRKRWYLACGFASLLPLVRPEGVFFVSFVGLFVLWQYLNKSISLRQLMRLGILSAFLSVAYLATMWFVYGDIVPHSVRAKSAGLYPIPVSTTVRQMMQFYAEYWIPYYEGITGTSNFVRMGALLTLILTLIGGIWLARKQPVLSLVLAMQLTLSLFFGLSATLLFEWYYGLIHPFLMLNFIAGLYVVITSLLRRLSLTQKATQRYITIVMILVLFLPTFIVLLGLLQVRLPQYPYVPPNHRERLETFYVVSEAINPLLDDTTTIAAPEIGVIGFVMIDKPILDSAGLVSPIAVLDLPVPIEKRVNLKTGAIHNRFMHRTNPDLLMTLEVFGRGFLLDKIWFQEEYTPVVLCPDENFFDSEYFAVFSRNDFAQGMALADQNIPCSR